MKFDGEQILERFWRKRLDVDLSFLNECDNEEVEAIERAPNAEGTQHAPRDEATP